MDHLHYPFPSKRNTVIANRGMVATSQPLAAQAGLDILKKAATQSMLPSQQQQHLLSLSLHQMESAGTLLLLSG